MHLYLNRWRKKSSSTKSEAYAHTIVFKQITRKMIAQVQDFHHCLLCRHVNDLSKKNTTVNGIVHLLYSNFIICYSNSKNKSNKNHQKRISAHFSRAAANSRKIEDYEVSVRTKRWYPKYIRFHRFAAVAVAFILLTRFLFR